MTDAPPEGLLAPELLARLERLQLGTRRRLAGAFSGEHRSTRHGSSLDFADYREYNPGDDFRRIDYVAWARLDQLLIRLFEAEDDLTLRLLVDTSSSMRGPKLRQAARIAAALGFVALVRRDIVTLHTFPLGRPAPRFTGRHAAHTLFSMLEGLEADGDTRFASAVTDLLSRPGPRGLTVVLSDLLTPEWSEGLTRLPARGGDVTVVHVLDPGELHPDLSGDLDLVDAETGRVVSVSLAPEQVKQYEQAAAAWADDVADRASYVGAAYVRVLSDDDIEPLVLGSWREAGVLR
ncbi:MAG: DUF58 domain-containing protein [Acidimicrobiia bacterium]|nr:DUF58 domain-containing protein [Acidimicrobiia bacterium]